VLIAVISSDRVLFPIELWLNRLVSTLILILLLFLALQDESNAEIRSFHSSALPRGVLPQYRTSTFPLSFAEPN
jgi:hypothetical protein